MTDTAIAPDTAQPDTPTPTAMKPTGDLVKSPTGNLHHRSDPPAIRDIRDEASTWPEPAHRAFSQLRERGSHRLEQLASGIYTSTLSNGSDTLVSLPVDLTDTERRTLVRFIDALSEYRKAERQKTEPVLVAGGATDFLSTPVLAATYAETLVELADEKVARTGSEILRSGTDLLLETLGETLAYFIQTVDDDDVPTGPPVRHLCVGYNEESSPLFVAADGSLRLANADERLLEVSPARDGAVGVSK